MFTNQIIYFLGHALLTLQLNENQQEELPDIIKVDKEETWKDTKEVVNEIKENVNTKKAPQYDLITDEVLKHWPRKAIVKLS